MLTALTATNLQVNIENLPVPNLFFGFGRPRLMNVLSVVDQEDAAQASSDGTASEVPGSAGLSMSANSVDARSLCNCSRNNSLLFPARLFSDPKLVDPVKRVEAMQQEANGARFGADYGTKCAVMRGTVVDQRTVGIDLILTLAELVTVEWMRFRSARCTSCCCASSAFVSWFHYRVSPQRVVN